MGCFPCFDSNSREEEKLNPQNHHHHQSLPPPPSSNISRLSSGVDRLKTRNNNVSLRRESSSGPKDSPDGQIAAQTFTFRELAAATNNFRPDCFLGEGGFGCVYRGRLQSSGQVVAVKQLDRNGLQGNREFLVEVLMLSLLHHPNLVSLIGYCADGDQRLLVYEFMALGSLEDHLHDVPPDREALDWNTRMKIAAGAAKGLEFLHDKANPPVIYRDFKSSNILLGEEFQPKLSDFGLAKLGPTGDKSHVSTRVMGTYGYCAPEYAMTGQLTVKSDVYSFGVVFLELITGRKAIDSTQPQGQQNLVTWARPLFNDRRKFTSLVDPRLEGRYPMRGLYQALAVASMCIQESAAARPLIGDVVTALSYLANQGYDPNTAPANINTRPKPERINGKNTRHEEGEGSGSGSGRSRWDLEGSEKEEFPKGLLRKQRCELKKEGKVLKVLPLAREFLQLLLRANLMFFYFEGLYYHISKRAAGINYVFIGKPMNQRPRYQILGMFLLVQLCIIAAEGLRRGNLASITASVQHTSLRVHQASGGRGLPVLIKERKLKSKMKI